MVGVKPWLVLHQPEKHRKDMLLALKPPRVVLALVALGSVSCAQRPAVPARASAPVPATSGPQVPSAPAAVAASPTQVPPGYTGEPFPTTRIADPAMTRLAMQPADAPGFDRAAYLRDPQAYLSVAAGGRCGDVAQPGPEVLSLEAVGAGSFTCPVGKSVLLVARTEPGMPVTYTSLGLGVFPVTGVNTHTVAADAAGFAQVEFAITAGTTGNVLVVAGSPVRAGQNRYIIRVTN